MADQLLLQVLDMLPRPISAVLPEECLDIARRLLAPGSALSDVARYAHNRYSTAHPTKRKASFLHDCVKRKFGSI